MSNTVLLSKNPGPKNPFATTAVLIASIDAPWGVDRPTAAVVDLKVYTSGDTWVGMLVYLHIYFIYTYVIITNRQPTCNFLSTLPAKLLGIVRSGFLHNLKRREL